MRFLLLLSALSLSACHTLDGWFGDDEGKTETVDKPAVSFEAKALRTDPNSDIELKIAKLSMRIDELEAQIIQQKERNKILERGLMLGIVPDELKEAPDAAQGQEKPKHRLVKTETSKAAETEAARESPKAEFEKPMALAAKSSEPKSGDMDAYRQKLQKAQDFFNNGNYGQAITVYNDIGAQFDDGLTEGSQHYWIGLSWFYLKEYKLAESSFQNFRDRFPHNPWNAHAGFYLAKIDQTRGFTQRALDQYQKILDEFPGNDLGEMAKAEIERMREKL